MPKAHRDYHPAKHTAAPRARSAGKRIEIPTKVEEGEEHLLAEVARVAREQGAYARDLADAQQLGDVSEEFAARSRLFRDRGLSLDTSVLPSLYEKIRASAPRSRKGRVRRLLGVIIHATASGARIGELCHLADPETGRRVMAEVIGILDDVAVLTPIGDLFGLSSVTEVIPTGTELLARTIHSLVPASATHSRTVVTVPS